MRKILIITILVIVLIGTQVHAFEFVVMGDFLNQDYLTQDQNQQTNKILDDISSQNPSFVLVPGDLVMARWFLTEANVRNSGNKIYKAWKQRFKKRGLKFYTAIGDHELGDLPAINVFLQGYLLPEYKKTYRRNFDLPSNSTKKYDELAYYFVKENTLFVTVMTFDIQGWFVKPSLSNEQLNWFEDVLKNKRKEISHIIVQGHLPVLSVKNGEMSSHMEIKNGTESRFWQIMKKYNVDYYLCGEHHALNVQSKNGITQVVTGGIVGKTSMSYAKFTVDKNIKMTTQVMR